MKTTLFRISSIIIGTALGFLAAELFAAAYLTLGDGKFVSAYTRYHSNRLIAATGAKNGRTGDQQLRHEQTLQKIGASADSEGCHNIDTLFPHPYLGWVFHGNLPCGRPESINNIGLHRHDFPAERDKDHFVILFTGGSVAEYVGGGNQSHLGGGLHPPYLEEELNARWISPNGKPFRVLEAGAGGWKQPQQAIMFLLYADKVDALITLDGANEMLRTWKPTGQRFETPFQHFAEANPLATSSFSQVVLQWELANFIGFLEGTWPFSYSNMAYIVADRLAASIDASVKEDPNQRTTMNSIFAAPKDWDWQRYWEVGQKEYQKYIREMHAIAGAFGVKDAYFLQSMSAVDKKLTGEEIQVVGDRSYGPRYQEWVENTLTLRADGLNVYSLLDVFRDETQTIYQDGGHSLWNNKTHESFGYRLIAKRMGETLADIWQFTSKPGSPASPADVRRTVDMQR